MSTLYVLDENRNPVSVGDIVKWAETFDLGDLTDYQRRCCTWEQAEAQHAAAIDLVKKQMGR